MLRLKIVGIALVALLMPALVAAQPPPPPGGGFGGGFGAGPGPRHPGGPGQHDFGPPMHPGPGGMGGPPMHRGPGGMGRPGFGGDIWERPEVRQRLDISEEQVQQLQQSRLELETKRIETQAKMEIARLNLESQLKKKEIDKPAVDALVDELGELHKENIRGLVQQKIALSEILDASQLDKVENFLDRARARDERRPFMENFQGRREDVGRMKEEIQKRREDRMEKSSRKNDQGPKKGNDRKDRKVGPDDKVGYGPPLGPHGVGGQRGPGFGGPQPSPPFPPSDFGETSVGDLGPVEDYLLDLGDSLDEALDPAQE